MRTSLAAVLAAAAAAVVSCSPKLPPPSAPAAEQPPPPMSRPLPEAPPPASASIYPPAPHDGTPGDPYRPLEAMDAPAVRQWLAAENKLVDAALGDVPNKQKLHDRLAELVAQNVDGPPVHRGKFYIWSHRDAQHDQSIIDVATSADGEPRVLLDPADFAKDGSLQFAGGHPSNDGVLYTYGLADGGGDWTHWHFRDIATGKDLPDVLGFAKYYAPVFTKDRKGVYYSRFPEPKAGAELTETDHDCKLYFHKLGTPVTDDKVIYERPDQPSWQFDPLVTRDGRFLIFFMGDGEVGDSRQEQVGVLDLTKPGAKIQMLVDKYEAEYSYVGNVGSRIYFQTDSHAPNKKLVVVDVNKPTAWTDVIPEGPHAIEDITFAGGKILVDELRDAHSVLVEYDMTGKRPFDVAMPGIGSLFGIGGRIEDPEFFYYFTSYTYPGGTFRVDLKTGKSTPWRPSPLAFDPKAFETTQVFFPSKDGTKIPMFITAKAGLVHDGSHPTVMTGYGFGGISLTPYYSPDVIAWIERGGVAVTVNIRGGGEYGAEWHHAAWREHEQVKLDDFIAGAEWLIANGWTTAQKLGMYGTSGGGYLVGAIAVQRPDLFGAVAPIAGVLDIMRFHLFGQGAGWQSDLGHPDVPAERAWLMKISPLHNVRAGTKYPAMFVVTSDHDVRVPPLHSYKFAAALQAAQAGPAPILLRVETESGHGGGHLRSQQIAQGTELLAFFAKFLGLAL